MFTVILLGESVLAAITGVRGARVTIAVSGLVPLFSLWWLYFLEPAGAGPSERGHRSYLWGYGHYGIFAALGAGLRWWSSRRAPLAAACALLVAFTIAAHNRRWARQPL